MWGVSDLEKIPAPPGEYPGGLCRPKERSSFRPLPSDPSHRPGVAVGWTGGRGTRNGRAATSLVLQRGRHGGGGVPSGGNEIGPTLPPSASTPFGHRGNNLLIFFNPSSLAIPYCHALSLLSGRFPWSAALTTAQMRGYQSN